MNAKFHAKLLLVLKRSYICYYIICMTVPSSARNTVSKLKRREKLQFLTDHPTVFGTNQTYSPTPHFVQILPDMQYFPKY